MKKFGIIVLLITAILQAYSQEVKSNGKQGKEVTDTLLKSSDETSVAVGNDLISVKDSKDAFSLRIGNRGMDILESLEGGHKIKFRNYPDNDDLYDQDDKSDNRERRWRSGRHFRGHWAGIEFGFNNYLTSDNSFTMPSAINYMTLHSGKSHSFNINFAQESFGITRHFGLVTGLGLNWNNYRFENNNNIQTDADGVIIPLDPGSQLERSKLTTLYLTVPLMLEAQIPSDFHRLNIGAGLIGAIKLASHTRMDFKNGDKIKTNDDFSLNLLRYGATARVGFENFHIYATYYLTPLFKEGLGPAGYDLYPFEVGFALTFND